MARRYGPGEEPPGAILDPRGRIVGTEGLDQSNIYYYQAKKSATIAESERIKAETELEKSKTDYLVGQMKGVPLPTITIPPAPPIEMPVMEAREIGGFSPLVFVGLYLLYSFFKKRGKK